MLNNVHANLHLQPSLRTDHVFFAHSLHKFHMFLDAVVVMKNLLVLDDYLLLHDYLLYDVMKIDFVHI